MVSGHRALTGSAFLVVLSFGGAARADELSEKQAAATSLFNEGRQLLADGKTAEACEKFALSLKFDKRVGTTLNLADCYEKIGKTASAWGRFNEAAALAASAQQEERVQYAKEHAAALEPKLARMTIALRGPTKDLVIKRDGAAVEAQAIGVAVPVDPGPHVVEATAPLKMPWSTTVQIPDAAAETPLLVPVLADDPEAIAAAKRAATAAVAPPERFWTGQRIAGAATAAVGLASVGLGVFFGLDAQSKWSDASGPAHCDATGCDPAGVAEGKDAATAGTISTIAFVAGGVLIAGGAALFLTGGPKRSEERALVLVPLASGGALRGTF